MKTLLKKIEIMFMIFGETQVRSAMGKRISTSISSATLSVIFR
jgi:hypothetical protein